MENRRLGQSDRARSRTKQHCVRRLIELTVAGCVVLGVSACSGPGGSNEPAVDPRVLGGPLILSTKGVVDFTYTTDWGFTQDCTGSMITPHVVLTAARCFVPTFGSHSGTVNVTINYYDPKYGRRVVHDGSANWSAHPNYPGQSREAIEGFAESAKDDLAVLVVPEVLGNLNTGITDYHDYLRIYGGDKDLLQKGPQLAYGAGATDHNGNSDDQLRYGAFDAEAETDYLKLEGTQTPDLRMCKGDSGGPFEYTVTVKGQPVPMLAAVWSNFNTEVVNGEGPSCAGNERGHDDSYACLMHDSHVQWVEGAAGISCVEQSGGSHRYRRCFDLPFIEDVPGEGLDANVATAIVASVLW